MQPVIKRYYNINRRLLFLIGGWPTQNKFMKILITTILSSLLFSMSFLEFIKISETLKNIMQDCECIIILILTSGANLKLFFIVLNSKNIQHLLSLIDYHWHIFVHSTEVQIMHDYAVVGRKITIGFIVVFYTLMCFFMLIPIGPQILDIIIPLNESRPYQYLFDVDYSFDREVYYYIVLLHSYAISITAVTTLISADSLYVAFSQHVCSLFAAIGQRLENLNLEINSWEDSEFKTHKCRLTDCIQYEKNEKIYRELIVILWKHQLSIEFVNLLNSMFEFYSFLLMLLNIAVISLVGVQILALMDHKDQMIRFIATGIGAFMHLFCLSYPGQRIIDHSSDIFDKAYNVMWYKLSRRSTQLLSILLCRCLVPCILTAGKLYVLSLLNYASTVQMAVSYFTTLMSVG